MTRDEYVESIKSAALSIGKKAVMSRLATKFPALFVGTAGRFFNPIVGLFVEKILVYAIKEGEMGAFFLYIDMRVDAQASDFEKKALEYHRIQQTGSPEEIKRAEGNLKRAFAAFVSLTN